LEDLLVADFLAVLVSGVGKQWEIGWALEGFRPVNFLVDCVLLHEAVVANGVS